MIALYIVLGVLLLLAALLSLPLYFIFSYEESFSVRLRYLFLTFPLYPSRKKAEQQQKQEESGKKSAEEEKKSPVQDIIKQEGLNGFLDILKHLSSIAVDAAKQILRHVMIKEFRLYLTVAGEDAADTALRFGGTCAAVYPAVGAIFSRVRYKKHTIEIVPDFTDGAQCDVKFYAKVRIRPYISLITAVAAFFRYLKLTVDRKKKSQISSNMKEQGGAVK